MWSIKKHIERVCIGVVAGNYYLSFDLSNFGENWAIVLSVLSQDKTGADSLLQIDKSVVMKIT